MMPRLVLARKSRISRTGGPIPDRDMARELEGIGEDGVAADLAVMREMHVRHDPVVAADAGHSRVELGAAVDGDVLADDVAVADLDRRVLAGVFLVLRRRADRGEMEDAVAPADASTAVEHDVRADPGALAQFDPGAYDRVRPDLDLCCQLRTVMDDGGGVNRRHAPQIGLTEHRMVAAATSSPATRAAQLNLLMPRSWRSKVTSISS